MPDPSAVHREALGKGVALAGRGGRGYEAVPRRSTPMRGQLADVRPVGCALPAGLVERRLERSDGPLLGQLMAAAYRGTVDDLGEDNAWHLAEAERTLRGDFGAVVWEASLAAAEGDGIVGTCLVTEAGAHLLLAFALVAPTWQNRGVGGTLMAHSAQALLSAGHREWTLAVTDGNPARRLYERLGFVPDGSLRTSTTEESP